MCSHKCFRMPTLIICGVVLTIILVCITGITLTNSINISNIVKLREKVASDSAAANGGHQAAQTRAALVEQQYSTLQQHHMSRSDLNYISASTHPKNLQRLMTSSSSSAAAAASASASASSGSQQQPMANQNKIVIEIGLRNSGNNDSAAGATPAIPMMPMPHMLQAAEALMEGNVDSISLPAVAAPLPQATTATTAKATTSTEAAPFDTSAELLLQHPKTDQTMAINDHNPAGIQFERRSHVKQVHREKKSVKFK